MKILHHPIYESLSTSVFRETFAELIQDQFVKIISPYLSPEYFMSLIESSSDWLLISDLEAWMGSISHNDRLACLPFIEANRDKIRHISKVHAKLVLNTHQAFIGSANLTISGVSNNFELGILLEEPDYINSLDLMFNQLWEKGWEPDIKEMKPYVMSLGRDIISTSPETSIQLPQGTWTSPVLDYNTFLNTKTQSTRQPELSIPEKQYSSKSIEGVYIADTVEYSEPWLQAKHLKSMRKSLIPIRVNSSDNF